MIIITDHAREAMTDQEIVPDEIRDCLEHGTPEIEETIRGEYRYGKQLIKKEKIIMVIYTIRGEDIRVITAYTLRRKQW